MFRRIPLRVVTGAAFALIRDAVGGRLEHAPPQPP
jgi:hypothetical protein